jgi:predicted metalloprotease
MSFDQNVRLDTSQVEDRRGSPLGGAGGTIAVGGGGLGLVLTLVFMLLGGNPADLSTIGTAIQDQPAQEYSGGPASTLDQDCRVGADANQRDDCRIVGFVNSIQQYWTQEFERRGSRYQPARTALFTGGTRSGCGLASSDVGPFYCPVDQKVFLDLSFFAELRNRFGARGGPFAEAYVLAHEYGHHVQNLIGTLERAGSGDTGPQSEAVRVELQADCLAGIWARHATSTGFLVRVTDADIAAALDAAAAVGDDRIQRSMGGHVNPERWTHGSSKQRQFWLTNGFRSGNLNDCDTFKGRV